MGTQSVWPGTDVLVPAGHRCLLTPLHALPGGHTAQTVSAAVVHVSLWYEPRGQVEHAAHWRSLVVSGATVW